MGILAVWPGIVKLRAIAPGHVVDIDYVIDMRTGMSPPVAALPLVRTGGFLPAEDVAADRLHLGAMSCPTTSRRPPSPSTASARLSPGRNVGPPSPHVRPDPAEAGSQAHLAPSAATWAADSDLLGCRTPPQHRRPGRRPCPSTCVRALACRDRPPPCRDSLSTCPGRLVGPPCRGRQGAILCAPLRPLAVYA